MMRTGEKAIHAAEQGHKELSSGQVAKVRGLLLGCWGAGLTRRFQPCPHPCCAT